MTDSGSLIFGNGRLCVCVCITIPGLAHVVASLSLSRGGNFVNARAKFE